MRTVVLASLRQHTRRYVATAVAVTIAVAFLVVTNGVTTALRNGLTAGVEARYATADVVVEATSLAEAQKVVDWSVAHGAKPAVEAMAFPSTVAVNGQAIDDDDTTFVVGSGPWARSSGAVVSSQAAKRNHIRVGDTITIDRHTTLRVVGLHPAVGGDISDGWIPWDQARKIAGLTPQSVSLNLPPGAKVDAVEQALRKLRSPAPTVYTHDAWIDQVVANTVGNGTDVMQLILLLFAAIAVFVAAMVIANTFTIVFTQRARDFALLRCLGATRRQVLRSVRAEASLLALLAASIGVLGGVVASIGVVRLLHSVAPGMPLGSVGFSPGWLGAAWCFGVVLTVASAWWPTRRAVTVSPLAALRPDTSAPAAGAAGRARLTAAALLLTAGAAALALAVHSESIQWMLAGGAATFVGVLLTGPFLVPAVVRLLGIPIGRTGAPARFAVRNTLRNPRRAAATVAALLVGVTLTTAVLTGVASLRATEHAAIGGGANDTKELDQALTMVTWVTLALLSIAVLIALVGIANTLGLSMFERQRENALLRALGLTRRQLRRAVGAEGLLLALTAIVIGTSLGIGYAWVGVHTLITQVSQRHATMQIPVDQLALVALAAILAGVLAAVIPARRSARVAPAAGLTFE